MFRCHISYIYFFFLSYLLRFTLCPYTTLFRSDTGRQLALWGQHDGNRQVNRAATRLQVMLGHDGVTRAVVTGGDRKSTRLNSSHVAISYAVFCLKKKRIALSLQLSTSHEYSAV